MSNIRKDYNFLVRNNFEQVYHTKLDNTEYFIYQSEDFKGYKATIGIGYSTNTHPHGTNLSAFFKASICSKEDTFDGKLGVNILLGRMVQEKGCDLNIDISNNDIDVSKDGGGISIYLIDFFKRKVERLAEYIDSREQRYKSLSNLKAGFNIELRKEFEEFK